MNSEKVIDKKDLFKGRNPSEIDDMLRANRDIVEIDTRRLAFLPGEIAIFKDELADATAQVWEMQKELDKIKKRFKEAMKPHQKQVARCAQALSEKTYEAEVELFGIADHGTGTMDFYNIAGEFIYSRPLRGTERQATIHSIKAS